MRDSKAGVSEFSSLRAAYVALGDIWRANGRVAATASGVKLVAAPAERRELLLEAMTRHAEAVRELLRGSGQRASVSGRMEVVLAVLAEEGGEEHDGARDSKRRFELAALLVRGRGEVLRTLCVTSRKADWRERLREFAPWGEIDAVIPAAEGNNQRAMVGMALQLADIGRGKLEMIEADLPEEVDEAAQFVKGADWLKAGLPRFRCAAGEALYYLMRIRSVHARMIQVRKQGLYTSMAVAALHASGLEFAEIAEVRRMPVSLVDRLAPRQGGASGPARLQDLGPAFESLCRLDDPRRRHCAARVWRGAAIHARTLDRRIRLGGVARRRLAAGGDLVSIAADLGIRRRDLVRILSVGRDEAVAEKSRFVGGVIDPELVLRVAAAERRRA
jgi:hypothetical protein